MSEAVLKYKLKGNESFSIREGWLNKGLSALENDPGLFSKSDAMDKLGVGSKMVKSIKYWLLACDLVVEKRAKDSKHYLDLTEDLGIIVKKYDEYFEDIFTLWILHYHLSIKMEFNTVWYLFFNRFNVVGFTKGAMVQKLTDEFNKTYNKDGSIYKSIEDDCSTLLKMYTANEESMVDPEENRLSPFIELGLISRGTDRGSYIKSKPTFNKLDRLAVLYVIVSGMSEGKKSVDIETLSSQENNVGKIFNLDRNMINEYLDRLRQEGYIELNRTAGLDMVYLTKDITPAEILEIYYRQSESED